MERYNPLAEGHVERVGHTKVGNRRIYVLVEPINTHAVAALEGYKYVEGKYTTTDGRIVRGWVYRPPPTEPEPERVEAPEDTEAPKPSDQCEKCNASGDALQIFDSDPEVYGVVCTCGHMWLVTRAA